MKNWNIEIRKVVLSKYLNTLKRLNNLCFPNSEDQLFEEDWVLCENFIIFVNERAVGYVSLQLHRGLYSYERDIYENKPDSLQLTAIGIIPSFRQMGLSELLLAFVIFYAKSEGFKSVNAITRASNKITQYLFKKFTFKITKKIKNFFPDGETVFVEEYFLKNYV